jgi:aminomethyltransferase
MTLRRTPFYALASAYGAQMGPVSGGFLSAHRYGDVGEEHRNTRTHVGVQDLSTMGKIDVKGPEAAALVDHLIVNDAAGMAVGQARYASVCTPQGGIMDDLTIFRLAECHFLIVTGSRNRQKIYGLAKHHAVNRSTYVTDITAAIAFPTVQGPNARALLKACITEADLDSLRRWHFCHGMFGQTQVMISRTGVTGELGFELFVPADEAAAVWNGLMLVGAGYGLRPYGVEAMFSLGLEKLYPAHGIDMDENLTPFHVGTDAFIRWDKGDFLGREALLLLAETGVATAWVGLWIEGAQIAAPQAEVFQAGHKIGHVTFSDQGYSVGSVLASAHIARAQAIDGAEVTVAIAGAQVKARITRKPFFDPQGARLRS